MADALRARLDEFLLATTLLTRIPVGGRTLAAAPASSVWAYPVVGGLVGAAGAGTLWLARGLGLPPLPAGAWAVAVMALATGGLHEDGLADTADGLGGGGTRARKLEIMRDSRIGSFGALALALTLTMRVTALAVLPPLAVVVVAAAARAAMLGVLLLLRPARANGLAAGLGRVPRLPAAAGLALAGGVAFVLPAAAAVWVLAAAALASVGTAWLADRQIGGHTGDVCGAAEQIAECLAFSVAAAILAG